MQALWRNGETTDDLRVFCEDPLAVRSKKVEFSKKNLSWSVKVIRWAGGMIAWTSKDSRAKLI